MNWLAIVTTQNLAQIIVERALNALPEGLLIAFFAWALLRVLSRQNSGTRFAVWFVALMTVATLPFVSVLGTNATLSWMLSRSANKIPAINLPAHWGLIVFSFWVIGVSFGMARLAFGMWSLRRLRQSCVPVAVTDLDLDVRQTLAVIDASVIIATSDRVRVPAAIGFWKKMIVLPAWALRELPADDLSAIILHESAHLHRGDDWTNLIQKVVRAVFFFHPAVWWIENRLSEEREMACDDAVLAQTANPRGYASCLVSLLEKSVAHRTPSAGWSMAQAAVHRAQEAALRLARILDANRPVATRVWKPALAIAGTFSLACLITLQHAPQFVAFDHVIDAGQNQIAATNTIDPAYGAMVQHASFHPAKINGPLIPTSRASKQTNVARTQATNPAHPVVARASVPLEEVPQPEQLIAVDLSANDGAINTPGNVDPQFPAVVFVQTRFIISDSQMWSVQIVHVTFINFDNGRTMKVVVPAVHSI
jgi:beta-lactamase regulating signal transducer with metallopeptidase domain